jgi:hypothetical protein
MTEILRDALNACFFQVPLEADDPRRLDLHEMGVRGTGYDPMVRLRTVIETADNPTQQLFSGFIGSGKSTELKVLARDLATMGFIPVMIDTDEHFNLTETPQTNDLLTAAAAGVDRFLQSQRGTGATALNAVKSLWERVRAVLGSEVEFEGATLAVPSVGELELKLKQNPPFKAMLYTHLTRAGKLDELSRKCHEFLDEAVAATASLFPDSRGLVIILDSFEKVRGRDVRHSDEVARAVEDTFVRDWKWLQLPCHVVYTVPPWLGFREFGASAEFGRVCILPMCRVTDKKTGELQQQGIAAMQEILEKRFDLHAIFADPAQLQPLIEASGGYPRDFLRMVRETLLSAIMGKIKPPIPADRLTEIVAAVIAEQVAMYDKPVYDEDLEMLGEVARTHDVPRVKREDAFRIAQLFEHHFVLCYRNGEEWYDLHPLVRAGPKVQARLKDEKA